MLVESVFNFIFWEQSFYIIISLYNHLNILRYFYSKERFFFIIVSKVTLLTNQKGRTLKSFLEVPCSCFGVDVKLSFISLKEFEPKDNLKGLYDVLIRRYKSFPG